MKTMILITACALVLLVAALAPTPFALAADDDTAAIQKRWADFAAAWNKHDPKAMAAVWAEDGDLRNPWGRLATGRTEVQKLFTDEHTGEGFARESTFRIVSEKVRLVSPDVAVHDAEITVTGGLAPDGTKGPPMEFIVTNVLKKAGGTWSCSACRPHLKLAAPPPPSTR